MFCVREERLLEGRADRQRAAGACGAGEVVGEDKEGGGAHPLNARQPVADGVG